MTGHFPSYDVLPLSYREVMAEHWRKIKVENKMCAECTHWRHFLEDEGECTLFGKLRMYDDSCEKWGKKEVKKMDENERMFEITDGEIDNIRKDVDWILESLKELFERIEKLEK